MPSDAKQIVNRYNLFKKERYVWLIHYQVLAEYFLSRKADFVVNFIPGMFLNRDLYDSTGVKAARVMAGALLGMLWPEEAMNFRFKKSKNIEDTKEHKDYFDEISFRQNCYMNEPACGLALTLNEYMNDDVIFGCAGVAVFEPSENATEDHYFLFQPWDIKRMVIEEAPNGMVNRIYYEREETVEQTVLEFGIDKVSRRVQDYYKNKQLDIKVNILHAIEPRYERDPDGISVFDMPVSSIYIELNEYHILKESGYPEMTVFVNRFFKNMRERYGRSPAMDALPDVLELNAIREAEIVATEKILDPPLGVLDDGRLGAGTVDTSAGAINVFNVSGRIGNQPPIFPLVTVGDLKITKERIEELKQSVSEHFMIDRLLDMNNETEMTLGEALLRDKRRAWVLSSLFSRQIKEVFTPLIKRCFNILLEKGELGVLPGSEAHKRAILFGEEVLVIPPDIAKAMLSGDDIYEIEYLTPAARMLQAELAEGILNTWKFMNDVAQTQPEVYDNVDEDKSVHLISKFFGAPNDILRDEESIGNIRQARAQAQAAAQKQQAALDTMKAMGHLKGLAQPPGAPGVVNENLAAPLAT